MSAAPAGAQGVSVRLGGVQARYADSLTASAASLSLNATHDTGPLRARFDLMHARFSSGDGSSTQAAAAVSAVRGLTATTALGFNGQAAANFLSGGTSAWSGNGELFAAIVRGGWLASAGLSGGGVRDITRVARPVAGVALDARRAVGSFLTAEARGAATWSRGVRYWDWTMGGEWDRGRFRAGASAGRRTGDLAGPLLQVHAEVRLLPRAWLEVAAGRYPGDLTGFTSGRFLNAGLRVPLRRPAERPFGIVVQARGDSGSRVTFEVPGAREVAIAGEWNQWRPAPLTRVARGRWQILLPLAPGAYRFSLVVDGDRWLVPPGVPRLPDDFGGEVGVLVL